MTHEPLQALLVESPLKAEVRALSRSLQEPKGFEALEWNDATRTRIESLERPLPMSLLPFGHRDERLLAFDFSTSAVERSVIPVLEAAPDGFWRAVAESLPSLNSVHATAGCPGIDFHRGRMRVASADSSARSLVSEVLQRPLHTMRSLADLVTVQEQALDLETTGALDPLASRLAHAGLDPEKWRIIGAERAIAKRPRAARHALESAAFLGASMENVLPAWMGLTRRSNMRWIQQILTFKTDFMAGGSP